MNEQSADPPPSIDHKPEAQLSETVSLTGTDQPAPQTESRFPAKLPDAPFIAGYAITKEIARGGMGRVLSGRELSLDREVAIKTLLPSANVNRFVTEAKITAKLPHPGIPPVYALGVLDDGSPYLAMKLIRGRTLFADLNKNRPTMSANLSRFVQIFEQIAQAVGFAHSRGVIHRDLKPLNVMVGEFGEVQVMDWGLAKDLQQIDADCPIDADSLAPRHADHTATGAILGTPAYMAPEQARGEAVDARADVFALGAILMEILTGKRPWGAGQTDVLLERAQNGEIQESLRELETCGADPDLIAVAQRCLQLNPEDRFTNASNVAQAVAEYRTGVETRLRQAEAERAQAETRALEERKRRRVKIAFAASVVLLGVASSFGVIVASLWRSSEVNREEAVAQKLTAERAKDEAVKQKGFADSAKVIAENARTAEVVARKRVEQATETLKVLEYGRSMQVAHQDWRDNNLAEMRALLDGADPLLRGWEWRYLHRLHDPSLLSLRGHERAVTSSSFSPDGARILTTSLDKTAKLWDAITGAELITFTGHEGVVNAASFSTDGARVITASNDKTAKVWDAKTGDALLTLRGHERFVRAAQFSPDGVSIITSDLDGVRVGGDRVVGVPGTAKVWNANSGAELLPNQKLHAATFSPDGARIVTLHWNGTAKLFDATTASELFAISGQEGIVQSATFSPDGTRIATLDHRGVAKVWNARTGIEMFTLKEPSMRISGALFSPDGSRIVTQSDGGVAKIWDGATGAELFSLRGPAYGVHVGATYPSTASFSGDGKRIVTLSYATAKVWDVKSGAELLTLPKVLGASLSPDGARVVTRGINSGAAKVWDVGTGDELFPLPMVHAASFSPDGSRIITHIRAPADHPEPVKVWDATKGAEALTMKADDRYLFAATFSPDGLRMVTAGMDGTAKVWDTHSGAELLTLRGHAGAVHAAAYSPDGSRLATGGLDKTAKVWNAQTGALLHTLEGHADSIFAVSFSPDGARIVTGSLDKTARIWDAHTGADLLTLGGHTFMVSGVAFSPDGARLVTGSVGHTAKLWNSRTGAELLTLKGHAGLVRAALFSPDGARLLTGSEDKTARIWDAQTGAELLTLKGHTGGLYAAAFDPEGKRVVTGSIEHGAKLWDARTGAELLSLKGHADAVSAASFSRDGKKIVTGSWDGTAKVWDSNPFHGRQQSATRSE